MTHARDFADILCVEDHGNYIGRHRLSNHWGWRGGGYHRCINGKEIEVGSTWVIKVNLNGGAFK